MSVGQGHDRLFQAVEENVEPNEESPLLQTSFPNPEELENTPVQSPAILSLAHWTGMEKSEMWRHFQTRIRYYIPIVGWLPRYKVQDLQYDITAGITVAFLIIPQALSYAQALVNVPPLLGLYSAFIPQFVYAILGTSRQLAVGPEALVSILVGSSIREYTQWRDTNPIILRAQGPTSPYPLPSPVDPYANIQPTALLCLLVGLFTFLLGFFRLGFLDSVLSRALLRGFVLAVACVVMIDMSPMLLGLQPPTGQCSDGQPGVGAARFDIDEAASPFQKLLDILTRLGSSHFLTTSISFVSISWLLAIKWIKKRYPSHARIQLIPEILVLVLASILLAQVFRWDCQGVAILNTVDGSLPDDVNTYPLPTLPKIKHLLLSAILISVIGFVESIAVAKTYASKHRCGVSPNRELVAMGVGNVFNSLFGGFPAYGSLGRSAVNDAAGAQTQLAGLVTGCVVFVTAMWLLPLFQFLPRAVCSSIIVVAALRLIELDEVYFIVRLHAWGDLGLLLLTFTSTIFMSIETGTLLSVGASLLLVVKHTTTTRLVLLGQTSVIDPVTGKSRDKYKNLRDEENGPMARVDGALLIRFEEGLFFGNVGQLKDRLKRIEMHGDLGVHPGEEPRRMSGVVVRPAEPSPTQVDEGEWEDQTATQHAATGVTQRLYGVVFDMKAVSKIDASATQTLEEIVHDYHNRQVIVCFVKLRAECRLLFQRSGLIELVGSHRFYNKISDAVQSIAQARAFPGSGSSDSHLVRLQVDPGSLQAAGGRSPNGGTTDLPFRRATQQGQEDQYMSFGLTPPN
ncbi:Solute carrier 26 [Kappamyces sp. JEL0829]|nr:Solute carrier 26 [Kappamyces sp. JEL0829]